MKNLNSDVYEIEYTSEFEKNQKISVRVHNNASFIIDSI